MPTVAAEDYRLVFELLKRHLHLEVSAIAKIDLDESQPELEGNRIVLNATKQVPAPQASKFFGACFPPRKEAWK